MSMYELLERILRPVGPSGMEGKVVEAIQAELKGHVDSMEVDAMGNLIVIRQGTEPQPKKIMLSAHMDHIGFVVTGHEKEGFLRVTNVGGIVLDHSIVRHITFHNGVEGVVACEPVKGGSREMKHLFVDIGASSQEEARDMVPLGEMGVYANDCFRLGAHRVASPAMDDRSACALLVQVMKELKSPRHTVMAVFTVQEEVGLRGAQTASFALAPDIGIALDVTAWGDTPEVKEPAVALGEGICVKIMDRASISHPGLRDELLSCGERAGVKTQREVLPFGGTDAGAMQRSRGGIPVCTLSIPCRYVHSACETIDLRDMEAGVKLLLTYLQ